MAQKMTCIGKLWHLKIKEKNLQKELDKGDGTE